MEQGDKVRRLTGIKFVADVTIEGEYKIKQMVVFREKLYLLIERPDTTPELYYVDEKAQQTKEVKFQGLSPPTPWRDSDVCKGGW